MRQTAQGGWIAIVSNRRLSRFTRVADSGSRTGAGGVVIPAARSTVVRKIPSFKPLLLRVPRDSGVE